MSASWSFNIANPSDVEMEITQRDQFNNDDVGLNDALVREVIQNSLDAHSGNEPVKVRFNIQNLADVGDQAIEMLREKIEPLRPNFEACNVPIPNERAIRVFTIEDFNTKGLTGSVDQKEPKENFTYYWRVVGKSKKEGQHGGRWGLGKLVFSSSSQIRTFFGITRRDGDEQPYSMGQVLLENHDTVGTSHKPNGFWHDGITNKWIQKPPTTKKRSKRLNWTGRIMSDKIHVEITHENYVEDQPEILVINLDLSEYSFPRTAAIVTEANHKFVSMKFSFSTIEAIINSQRIILRHFRSQYLPKLRLMTKDIEVDAGSLLASAKEISVPEIETGDVGNNIFNVDSRNLGEEFRTVEFKPDEYSKLIINHRILELLNSLEYDKEIQDFVLPAAFRTFLTHLTHLNCDSYYSEEQNSWDSRCYQFCREQLGASEFDQNVSESETKDSVDHSVTEFAALHSFAIHGIKNKET